jgi:periplasmic mercuric ion binding protein
MKTTIKSILIAITLLIGISSASIAQEKKKIEEIKIKTSAICGMCKERIESNIKFEKGVTFVELDNETKVATIKYRSKKTNPDKLRQAISKLGHDADDVMADKKAYDKLPACCKKDVDPH